MLHVGAEKTTWGFETVRHHLMNPFMVHWWFQSEIERKVCRRIVFLNMARGGRGTRCSGSWVVIMHFFDENVKCIYISIVLVDVVDVNLQIQQNRWGNYIPLRGRQRVQTDPRMWGHVHSGYAKFWSDSSVLQSFMFLPPRCTDNIDMQRVWFSNDWNFKTTFKNLGEWWIRPKFYLIHLCSSTNLVSILTRFCLSNSRGAKSDVAWQHEKARLNWSKKLAQVQTSIWGTPVKLLNIILPFLQSISQPRPHLQWFTVRSQFWSL